MHTHVPLFGSFFFFFFAAAVFFCYFVLIPILSFVSVCMMERIKREKTLWFLVTVYSFCILLWFSFNCTHLCVIWARVDEFSRCLLLLLLFIVIRQQHNRWWLIIVTFLFFCMSPINTAEKFTVHRALCVNKIPKRHCRGYRPGLNFYWNFCSLLLAYISRL